VTKRVEEEPRSEGALRNTLWKSTLKEDDSEGTVGIKGKVKV
jgi:hypothetical protein